MNGILSDSELVALGRIELGIYKIEKLIDHLNALTRATGLPLRHVDKTQLALLENDIVILSKAHELAEQKIKESAMAMLDKNIASGVGNFDKQADNRIGTESRTANRRSGKNVRQAES